jgi:hypothetical protein
MIKALEVHTKGKDGNFIAVNHFTKEGGLLEFDSNDITENLIKSLYHVQAVRCHHYINATFCQFD